MHIKKLRGSYLKFIQVTKINSLFCVWNPNIEIKINWWINFSREQNLSFSITNYLGNHSRQGVINIVCKFLIRIVKVFKGKKEKRVFKDNLFSSEIAGCEVYIKSACGGGVDVKKKNLND